MNRRRHAWVALLIFACFLGFETAAFGQATAPSISAPITGDYGPHMPPDYSQHGQQMDRIINILHVFMAVLFFGWGVFLVRCLVVYRQRAGHKACYELIKAKPAKAIEVAVIIFEVILLVFFSMPAWAKVKNDIPTDDKNPVKVRVVAEQFAWNFHYPGPDGLFGQTGPQFINLVNNPVGLDKDGDPHAKDDIVKGELHLPNNRPVICYVSSKDVIHSFNLPVMRIKQDTIPGMRIPVWFRIKEGTEGNFEVACAQLCGNNHYNMKALMVVESEAKFNAWLEKMGKPAEEFKD